MWGHLLHLLLVHVNLVWIFSREITFCKLLVDAFEVVVHWRHNSFLVPSGKVGKDFVLELARLVMY